MRSDKLYKFSDRTLIRLQTLLDDITKNIQMEYLPKRRWSTLEKKRANIMIKAIDKQLKERSQNRRDLPRDIPLDSVEVLRSLLEGYELGVPNPAKINVLDAMNLAISAWTMDVSANTIANCFRHCKLRSTDNMTFENSDEGGESTQEL
ncbi:hypothetical protein Tco_0401787 [Tanacetum coccineum]